MAPHQPPHNTQPTTPVRSRLTSNQRLAHSLPLSTRSSSSLPPTANADAPSSSTTTPPPSAHLYTTPPRTSSGRASGVFDSPTRGGSSRSAFTPSLLRYPPPLIERANDGGVRRNDLSVSHELRLPGDAEESEDEVEGKREGGEGGAEAAKRTPNRKEKEANRMEDEEEKAVEDVEEGEEGATAYRLKSLRADKKEAFDARARMRTRTRDEANARTSIEFIRDGSTSPSHPPSFERSEFETIVRRLRTNAPGSLKRTKAKIFGGVADLDNDWEFAGWGSVSYIPLSPSSVQTASARLDAHQNADSSPTLIGQFRATSVAGNAVYASVFYSLPAVVNVAGSLSPLSVGVACVILLLWRGIMVELGGAMRLNGGNYSYMLNVSGKTLALLGAAVTLLDVVATGTVSAGTAADYIGGELKLPFESYVFALLILVALSLCLLAGVKDSTRLTLSICLLHLATMAVLIVCSIIAWARIGNDTLANNWTISAQSWTEGTGAARAVFNGVCVGFLGVTGVECVPTFIEQIKPRAYSSVIRNLLYGALILNVTLLLLIYAILPSSTILTSSNILSLLASSAVPSSRWLRVLVVVDAAISLMGGVLCGGMSCCGLLEGLARDKVLPAAFLRKLPVTEGAWVSVMLYLFFCIVFYATAGFSLTTISNVFSMAFTLVMLFYTISSFLHHYNLPHLPVPPPFYRCKNSSVVLAFLLSIMIIVGNVVLMPTNLLLTLAYIAIIFGGLWIGQREAALMRFGVWSLDQTGAWPWKALGHRRGRKLRESLRRKLVGEMRRAKRERVVAWVKNDEISTLIQIVLYTLKNEQTSHLVLVHVYDVVDAIPSELQANAKLLDEAFPALTIDLRFVQGSFGPVIVQAVTETLEIPSSLNLIGCPLPRHGDLAAFGGARAMRA